MSPQTNSLGFLYLDQNGLLLYTTGTSAVIQFAFPIDLVRDLEVINKELLQKEIRTLIKNNNLAPARYIIALSENVLFEKPFHDSKSLETQKEIQEFLDNMPFEHTTTIIFENAESKLIATNKDLYQSLVRILQQEGSVVEYILPSYVLGVDVTRALSMTKELLLEVHRKAPSLRQYSFLTDAIASPQNHQAEALKPSGVQVEKKSDPEKKRIFLLVGVFVFLLAILGIVILITFRK